MTVVPDREAEGRAREVLEHLAPVEDGEAAERYRAVARDVLTLVERVAALERERDSYLARVDEVVVEKQRQEVRAIEAERERDAARRAERDFARWRTHWRERAQAAEVRVAQLEETLRLAEGLMLSHKIELDETNSAADWTGFHAIDCEACLFNVARGKPDCRDPAKVAGVSVGVDPKMEERRPYMETFQARVDGVKRALGEIVDETEQSDRIDKVELWASKALDAVAREADALVEKVVVLQREVSRERVQRTWAFEQLRMWWRGEPRDTSDPDAAIAELDRVERALAHE